MYFAYPTKCTSYLWCIRSSKQTHITICHRMYGMFKIYTFHIIYMFILSKQGSKHEKQYKEIRFLRFDGSPSSTVQVTIKIIKFMVRYNRMFRNGILVFKSFYWFYARTVNEFNYKTSLKSLNWNGWIRSEKFFVGLHSILKILLANMKMFPM